MKTVEFKKVTSMKDGDNALTYANLAKYCVNAQSKTGFNVEEMKARLRLITIIDEGKGEIEDADFKKLKSLVNNFNWGKIHQDIVEFVDYINDIK